ncbi:INO80 complex subunit B [Drosophila biarmipes]|uniref:INO80 complex subunit B n=1 Tax=Drosophila biarmipes TaxID=125945 RepID=UPI0007E64A70|nr:INO80 complex subunit B [Drosophila biarmipes]
MSNNVQSKSHYEATELHASHIYELPFIRARNIYSKKSAQAATSPNAVGKKVKRRHNSETSSEEERWLTAIETGKMDDVDDELKKIKNPKLMTARQRAMYERADGFVEELIALPSGYKEKEKPQTEEEIQKAILKSEKRKQQANARREKDKQKTIERLLKKQETNKHRMLMRNRKFQKSSNPKITYISALKGNIIIIPPGQDFPQMAQLPRAPPLSQLCHVSGCGNRKAYTCSTTNVPLCSLICYRKNILHSVVQ